MSAPKPWSFEVHELSEGRSGIVYDAIGYRVGTDHLSEDDARLIAAAPEMLEALRELCAEDGNAIKGMALGLAAIAKATGAPE